jgi:hypothetical protein
MEVQLRDRTTKLATTTTDLLFQQVLDNLARQIDTPAALPSLDVPVLGEAQIQRSVGVSYQPGWDFMTQATSYAGEYLFDKQQATLTGQQSNEDAWRLAPLNNPDRIYLMQCAYHRAIGNEDSQGASILDDYFNKRTQALQKATAPAGPSSPGYSPPKQTIGENGRDEKSNAGGSGQMGPAPAADKPLAIAVAGDVQKAAFMQVQQQGGGGEGGGANGETGPIPNIDYKSFLTRGWFGVGQKKDVPKDACYVAKHGQTYVWVCPCHFEAFSRFTLVILDIATPSLIDQGMGQTGTLPLRTQYPYF